MTVQTLSQTDYQLIKDSWSNIKELGGFGEKHYTYLFKEHPELVKLFNAPIATQAFRLEYSFDMIVANYDTDYNGLKKYLKRLGVMHKGFKVKKKHYPIIRESMNSALKLVDKQMKEPLISVWNKFLIEVSELMT